MGMIKLLKLHRRRREVLSSRLPRKQARGPLDLLASDFALDRATTRNAGLVQPSHPLSDLLLMD